MTKKINRGQSLKDKKSADVQGGWFVYLLLKFALNYETFLFRPRCEEDTSQEFIVNEKKKLKLHSWETIFTFIF